jgi:flagellar P-ring protein precursor FlgI
MKLHKWVIVSLWALAWAQQLAAAPQAVRIKDLGRIDSVRENSLVGYGLVTGLAGTGDSSRFTPTLQSVANMLARFGVIVPSDQINSRNVAAVTVTTSLPAFARPGDTLDVNVSSVGDARSLTGGTLLMTPLAGPDTKIYALAQGAISVGGYKYDLNGNVVQKNHPTAGMVPGGAIVENAVATNLVKKEGTVSLVLFEPDFTTANRIAQSLNEALGGTLARALDAGRVEVAVPQQERDDIVGFLTRMENALVTPDQRARVVVNERTGTVVSGGDVRISMVTVSQGDLRVSVVTDYLVSQPSLLVEPGPGVRTEVVPRTRINVEENAAGSVVSLPAGTTVADLISALNKVKASTRDIITILQSMKKAGALHAELIIQ